MMYQDLTKIPIIDTHVHVFPQKLSEAVRQWFEGYAWKFKYEGSPEELLQTQFDNGVAGLVLLSYAHRPGIADQLNDYVASLIKRFPYTAGLATLHPEDKNHGDIIKRAHEELGLCGVKLHCHVQKVAPDDPVLFPTYEALIQFDGVLNIHAGREPAIDAYGLDVRAISGARRVEKVLRRYPELKIIVPHLGFDESDRFYSLLEGHPTLYLDTTMMLANFFDAPVNGEKLIRYADRILYGSDYPHIPYSMEREVRGILEMDLGEDVTRKIFYVNATKLFPIKKGDGL
ncbi:MAG: amidohydrolase family protein [Desulfobacteraceae bacterium]